MSKKPKTAAELALLASGFTPEEAGKRARMSKDYVLRAVRRGVGYHAAKRLHLATGIPMELLLNPQTHERPPLSDAESVAHFDRMMAASAARQADKISPNIPIIYDDSDW